MPPITGEDPEQTALAPQLSPDDAGLVMEPAQGEPGTPVDGPPAGVDLEAYKREVRASIERGFAEKAAKALAGDPAALASLSSYERRALRPVLEQRRAEQAAVQETREEFTLRRYGEIQRELAGYASERDFLNTLVPQERQWFRQFQGFTAQLGLADGASVEDVRRAIDAYTARERSVAMADVGRNTDPWDEYDRLVESEEARLLTPEALHKLNPENYRHTGTNVRAISAMIGDFWSQVAEVRSRTLAAPVAAAAVRANGRADAMAAMAAGSPPIVPAGRGAPRSESFDAVRDRFYLDPSPANQRAYEEARKHEGYG